MAVNSEYHVALDDSSEDEVRMRRVTWDCGRLQRRRDETLRMPCVTWDCGIG